MLRRIAGGVVLLVVSFYGAEVARSCFVNQKAYAVEANPWRESMGLVAIHADMVPRHWPGDFVGNYWEGPERPTPEDSLVYAWKHVEHDEAGRILNERDALRRYVGAGTHEQMNIITTVDSVGVVTRTGLLLNRSRPGDPEELSAAQVDSVAERWGIAHLDAREAIQPWSCFTAPFTSRGL